MTLVHRNKKRYRRHHKKRQDGIDTMNNLGFFAAYNGMLNVAARRDMAAGAAKTRRARRGLAARLFGRA